MWWAHSELFFRLLLKNTVFSPRVPYFWEGHFLSMELAYKAKFKTSFFYFRRLLKMLWAHNLLSLKMLWACKFTFDWLHSCQFHMDCMVVNSILVDKIFLWPFGIIKLYIYAHWIIEMNQNWPKWIGVQPFHFGWRTSLWN